ncbi:MAG: FAD-dependent oxidoreductase [Thermohalobaculum sp.]|nr:FAD-dependent oxidoreductase [Thermohalobaculum sp.]
MQDVVVVGGGLVGLAAAYGLARRGRAVALIAEGDEARPASVGNFGLVWVQSKGQGMPAYTAWTARSAMLWPDFAARLAAETGIDVGHRCPGGLHLCLGEAELEARARFVAQMSNQMGAAGVRVEMLDRAQVREIAPAVGDAVTGASWCAMDGDADPFRLARALNDAARARGMRRIGGAGVAAIRPDGAGYRLALRDGTAIRAARVVLAAGLGNAALAASLGKPFPVRPQRGQILVTGRLPRFLDLPTTQVRQTAEGSVLLGDSKEDVGFDHGTTMAVGAGIAARAVAAFPVLVGARVVRTWGALRVMSPDGFPIYQTWPDLPGVWALACHSGVTLAAAHAGPLADAIDGAAAPPEIAQFTTERFDVPTALAG